MNCFRTYKKIALVSATCASIALLSGCAKDRTLDDYLNEKQSEDLGKIQPAAGVYRGIVYSKADQSVMGALEVTLTPQSKVIGATASTKAQKTAQLTAKVAFTTQKTMVMVADDSNYQDDTFVTTVTVPGSSDTSRPRQLSLSGTLADGKFQGSLEAFGYPENGGTFTLERDGTIDSQALVAAKGTTAQFGGNASAVFTAIQGTTTFANGSTRPVQLIILKPDQLAEEDLYWTFSPTKAVNVTFNYGNSLQLNHANARLDERTGTLTGKTALPTVSGGATGARAMNLDCSKTPTGEWKCNHLVDSVGLAAVSTFSVKNKIAAPSNLTAQTGDSAETAMVQRVYKGTAKGVSPLRGTWESHGEMTVIYPARTLDQALADLFAPSSQKNVQVTLSFNPTEGATDEHRVFPATIWERTNRTLDSTTVTNGTRGPITNTLKCQNFDIYDTSTTEVNCQIVNNQLSAPIELKLKLAQ